MPKSKSWVDVNPHHGCCCVDICPLVKDTCRTTDPPLATVGPHHHVACHYLEELKGLPNDNI